MCVSYTTSEVHVSSKRIIAVDCETELRNFTTANYLKLKFAIFNYHQLPSTRLCWFNE